MRSASYNLGYKLRSQGANGFLILLLSVALNADTQNMTVFQILVESCFQTNLYTLTLRNGYGELTVKTDSTVQVTPLSRNNFDYLRKLGRVVHATHDTPSGCTFNVFFSGEQGDAWECLHTEHSSPFIGDMNHIVSLVRFATK